MEIVPEEEAKSVLGARSRRGGGFDWGKWAMQTGIMMGASIAMSGLSLGAKATAQASEASKLAGASKFYSLGTKFGYNMPNMSTIGAGLSRAMVGYSLNKAVNYGGLAAGVKPTTTQKIRSTPGFAAS